MNAPYFLFSLHGWCCWKVDIWKNMMRWLWASDFPLFGVCCWCSIWGRVVCFFSDFLNYFYKYCISCPMVSAISVPLAWGQLLLRPPFPKVPALKWKNEVRQRSPSLANWFCVESLLCLAVPFLTGLSITVSSPWATRSSGGAGAFGRLLLFFWCVVLRPRVAFQISHSVQQVSKHFLLRRLSPSVSSQALASSWPSCPLFSHLPVTCLCVCWCCLGMPSPLPASHLDGPNNRMGLPSFPQEAPPRSEQTTPLEQGWLHSLRAQESTLGLWAFASRPSQICGGDGGLGELNANHVLLLCLSHFPLDSLLVALL